MKIKATVLSATDEGDHLMVEWQGTTQGDAAWRPYRSGKVRLPMTEKTKRAYFVGREFKISFELVK